MKTITFYSYKGGVGRSLALVNVATRLAEFNKKVCLLDFDLEAPGLHFKFQDYIKNNFETGIVDYIHQFTSSGALPTSIKDYTIDFEIGNDSVNSISLIPAGNTESKSYWQKLSSIDWNDLLYQSGNGIELFLDLKEKIQLELKPDFLLIDSRTGISEMSGITLSLLADEVVIVSAHNKENLNGSKKIISSISNPENVVLEKVPKITFVLSRIPFTEKPEDKAKEQILVDQIKKEFLSPHIKEISVIHSDRELELIEKIKIGYKKDESTAQIAKDYLNLFEILTKGYLTNEEIRVFNNIKEAGRLYIKAIEEDAYPKKLELIEQALLLTPNKSEYKLYKAFVLKRLSRFDDAIEILRELTVKNENYSQAFTLLGHFLLDQGNNDSAIVQLQRALKIDKNDPLIYLGLGRAYQNKGEYEKSNELFSQCLKLDPSYSLVYNNRANNYRLLGQYELALKDIYKALELDSEDSIAYLTLAEINSDLNKLDDFYLNVDLALKFDQQREVEDVLLKDKLYKKYFKEERFLKLLEKHNISLPTQFEQTKSKMDSSESL
jgi:tetratricopeptide (TPR) repeat protein